MESGGRTSGLHRWNMNMKSFFKWAGIVSGLFLVLIMLAGSGMYLSTQARLEKVYDIPVEPVVIPSDAEAVAEGERIFGYRGCLACHGQDLGGNVYLSDPALGEVIASNLTVGVGGVGATYDNEDWVRAIRHGLRPDGTPLLFMPSTEFYYLSDADLGRVVAFVKSVPPSANLLPASALSLTGRMAMVLVKDITFAPTELIPHDAPRPSAPEPGETPEFGEYLAISCKVCHGLSMSGGPIPVFPADYPSAANLTTSPKRPLPYWDKEGFVNIMRSGVTRHGRQIDPQYMPWTSYKYATDEELAAIWAYLQSLPPVAYGNR